MKVNILQVVLRLLCAMLVGFAIGVEREWVHRPAGMRTHMVVAIGACVVMITGELIFVQSGQYGAWSSPDRMAAQVISGIGFLGAGTIIREGVTIRGLTTAASLWAVASLGLAAGAGFYFIAICGTAVISATLTLLRFWQDKRFRKIETPQLVLRIECAGLDQMVAQIERLAETYDAVVLTFHFETARDSMFVVEATLRFAQGSAASHIAQFAAALRATDPGAVMHMTLV